MDVVTHVAWVGDCMFFRGGGESFLALRVDCVMEKCCVMFL